MTTSQFLRSLADEIERDDLAFLAECRAEVVASGISGSGWRMTTATGIRGIVLVTGPHGSEEILRSRCRVRSASAVLF